ncbi:hypothetical protein BO71DRAFT_442267 [Aspergillus ellipticus CBS 707.79]|uniref:Uncharacterized protein n=1 Tax=Aspergillus ellipticus CBS 707.79 TaxID=1448320 RepID=A0A319DES1_9EURO|nr:hypothetical protein BO71DRAFT_442267 [Aspergillus ellipticus CBS 707.79]
MARTIIVHHQSSRPPVCGCNPEAELRVASRHGELPACAPPRCAILPAASSQHHSGGNEPTDARLWAVGTGGGRAPSVLWKAGGDPPPSSFCGSPEAGSRRVPGCATALAALWPDPTSSIRLQTAQRATETGPGGVAALSSARAQRKLEQRLPVLLLLVCRGQTADGNRRLDGRMDGDRRQATGDRLRVDDGWWLDVGEGGLDPVPSEPSVASVVSHESPVQKRGGYPQPGPITGGFVETPSDEVATALDLSTGRTGPAGSRLAHHLQDAASLTRRLSVEGGSVALTGQQLYNLCTHRPNGSSSGSGKQL